MIKLPKAIIKKFGITKRAWAEFRKQKGGGNAARPAKKRRASAKKIRVSGESKEGDTKMAKRRKKSVKGRARRVSRRVGAAMATKPGKVLAMAGMAAAGGVASSFVVNRTPIVKDQGRGMKAAIQGAAGLAAILFVKNRHVKGLGAGAVIAAAMGLTREFLKLEPLAGPSAGSRTLSPSEMQRLTNGQMNIPMGEKMGVPLSGFARSGFGS